MANTPTGTFSKSLMGVFTIPSHGEREMPVWGRQFLEEDQKEFGAVGGEAVTEERIHQLTEYVQSLQKK